MTSVNDILSRARGEIGYKESPTNRTKYGEWYGTNGAPWCAMFVSWVFYHEGLPLPFTKSKGFAAVRVGVAGFQARKQWHTSNPRPGDVVFFTYSHVGIVESVNSDGSVISIEGNSSHRVQRVRQPRSKIRGYGRPNYDNDTGVDEMPLSKEDKAWIKNEIGSAYKMLARAEGTEGKQVLTHIPQSVLGTYNKVNDIYARLNEQLNVQATTIESLQQELVELKQKLPVSNQ